ncbi:uncharacterized protein LOC103709042 [Phoenix dactylifera]|uniref:Uncharacterized protein LOC103709042 n=1 Tax=Phoenix dactylifera TaxID=42345 RepID=A0A8B7C5X0_PHODC|nr:uncharacterized protein LOC103709042 [Phoenix dactylifera]
MAGELEQTDVSIYSNWKNRTMLSQFLRPKVLGVSLVGTTDLKEVDVFMHHPAEIFGSEPGWKHKFFFTNPLRNPPRERFGYWMGFRRREIIKENDGKPIGFTQQYVFYERMYVFPSKRTKWHLNVYWIFDDNKKVAAWLLCELFQKNVAEKKDSEAFPGVNPTLGGDQLPESIFLPAAELEQLERDHGSSPGSSAREEVNQPTPSASDGGQGDSSAYMAF